MFDEEVPSSAVDLVNKDKVCIYLNYSFSHFVYFLTKKSSLKSH